MRKILVTGKDGQIGWELQRTLAPLGKIFAFDRQTLDLSKPDLVRQVIRTVQPDIIVNSAAYTAVDKAETDVETAQMINGITPGILAEEAKKLKALLVHYSTDYVFDGQLKGSYQENDQANPLSSYGKSKLAGEQAIQAVGGKHFIFRTSWVYASRGKNFLLTMLRLAKERESLKIVNDQVGAPTWSRIVAEMTAKALTASFDKNLHEEKWGVYHLTSAGQTTWYEFARTIFEIYQQQYSAFKIPELLPITTAEYPLPAKRPNNSVLSNQKLSQTFDLRLPDWKSCLELCMKDL